MNNECSICLSTINDNDIYKLSCNHIFHKSCFYKCMYSNNMNIFIRCPLCREMNINNIKSDNSYNNIKNIVKTERCKCKTKNGTRCKNKSYILNYGMCHIHNKNILPKNRYNIMSKFIYWLIETPSNFKTKISIIDIIKQLCIKYNEIENLEDLLHYVYRFHAYSNNMRIVNKQLMYEYYDLIRPDELWVEKCIKDKIII